MWYKKAFASSLVTALVISTGFYNNSVLAKERLSGTDRYETSREICASGWQQSECVIIANGDDYADALCAAPLAKSKGAPILLTSSDSIKDSVLKEIQRLKASKVIVIGGESAISKNVENKLKAIKGVNVKRIYGNNRYETSLKIAKELENIQEVALVTGNNYADALSIAPIAAQKSIPILMVNGSEIKKETEDYINSLKDIHKVYIIGGEKAVGKNIEEKIKNSKRLYGIDRFETNLKVMQEFQNELNFQRIYISRGNGPKKNEFADALSGSVLAAKHTSPIILVDNEMSENTENYVKYQISPNTKIICLGGEKVVNDSIGDNLKISSEKYSEDGKTYGSDKKEEMKKLNGNVLLDGKNVTLQNAEIQGNVYMEKENTSLKNVIVNGVVYVDQNGKVNLDNVKAKEIRIFNASQDGVHLKNVTCDSLMVEAKHSCKPRVSVEGINKIGVTTVTSSATLDATQGEFGKISIGASSQINKVVELIGKFKEEIKVTSSINLKSDKNSQVKKLNIASEENEKVKLEGKYEEVSLTKNTNIELEKDTEIKEIKAEGEGKKSNVEVPKGAKVEKADKDIEFKGEGSKDVGKTVQVPPTTSTTPTTPTKPTEPTTPTEPEKPKPPVEPENPDPSGKETKIVVTVNKKTVNLYIFNAQDDRFTLAVYKKGSNTLDHAGEIQAIKDASGTIKYTFDVNNGDGEYYGFIRGEKTGKIQIPNFKIQNVTPSVNLGVDTLVNGKKVTLKFNNISPLETQFTIKICKKGSNDLVHVDQLESRDIVNGHAEYTFTVDPGTYYGRGFGVNSGAIEIEEFIVK